MATSEYEMVAPDEGGRLIVWPPSPAEGEIGGTIVLQPGDRIPDGSQDLVGSTQGYGLVMSANALPGQKEPDLTDAYAAAVALRKKQDADAAKKSGGQPSGDDG